MAINVKYRLEAESRKYKHTWRFDILQEGYTGAVEYKNIGAGKIKLAKKNGGKIHGTSVVLSIQAESNFEYADFFQYNNSKHPARLYKNNTCVWSGYLNAETHVEPYRNPPYDVQLIATDGLARLKNTTWGELGYSGFMSRLDIINACLGTLGLGLGYSIAIDLFEDSMQTNRAMLAQLYNYTHIFNENTLYEVIEKLLPLGASITQQNNRWLIRRNKEDSEKTHFLYNQLGEYEGTENGESVYNLGAVGAHVWPHGMPNMEMVHAWRNAIIKLNYGKKESFLLNYNFALPYYSEESKRLVNTRRGTILPSYKINTPFWENPDSIDINLLEISGQPCVKLLGSVTPGTEKAIEQTVENLNNTVSSGGSFVFSCKYNVAGGYYSTTLGKLYPIEVDIKIMVKLSGSTTYYLTTEGWTTTQSYIEETVSSTGGEVNWSDFKIITSNLPIDGDLTIKLYQVGYNSGSGRTTAGNITGIYYTDIRAYTSELNSFPDPEEIELPILENAFISGEEVEVMPTDLPATTNAEHFFENGNYTESGGVYTPASLWVNNSGDAVSLLLVIQNQLLSYHGVPTMCISSQWRSDLIHLNSVVTHPLNDNRKFFVESGQWDLINDTFNIKFEEIPNSVALTDTDLPWILADALWGDTGEIWIDTETWKDGDSETIADYDFYGISTSALTGINPGDTILTLPDTLAGVTNGLQDGEVYISSLPHTVTGIITYKVPAVAVQSYQVEFEAIINGVEKKVIIKIHI